MSAAGRKSKAPELRVVFDTGTLYTGSASDLVQREAADIIRKHGQHPDLKFIWYLPDVVRHERQFQMQKRALDLLPSIQKLERVLGHQLNITEPIILQRLEDAVETQLRDLGFNVLDLDTTRVDWNRLMLDACYRRPPFEDTEREKGFRDALIVEAFMQLVEDSPKTPQACRVILVTGDGKLAGAVQSRATGLTNVRILKSIEELRGLINTLVEEVTEEFVATYKTKAEEYFFERDQRERLYYRENITDKIKEEFSEVLKSVPEGADSRTNETWYISTPQFVRKQRQRVFWSTRITVEAKAYRWTVSLSSSAYAAGGTPVLGGTPSDIPDWRGAPSATSVAWISPEGLQQSDLWQPRYLVSDSLPSTKQIKELFKTGESIFEVVWSILITTRGEFRSPKIESLKHVETNWE
jgi:hypothetical protein